VPAIAEQVATIEHDLQEALATIESLTEERDTLKKALVATTVEKSELEAKQGDMQSLVDETREMVDRLANMSLDMLRSSRRPIASPKEAAGYNAAKANHEAIVSTGEAEARKQGLGDLTGENIGLRGVPPSESAGTAVDRLRAQALLDTAAPGALEMHWERATLPDRMPMFLQQTQTAPRGARHASG
jgi:hypothetical protein